MTTKELLEKYPDGEFNKFPGDREFRYKVFAPLFENLYESKLIYHENGKHFLIRVDDIEITPDGFSATAAAIKFLFTNREMPDLTKWEKWIFGKSWQYMTLGDWLSFHTPYANHTIFLDKELIKQIEELIHENRFDEMHNVVYRDDVKYFEEMQKDTLQKTITEIGVLTDFAKCWSSFNPYHIKKHLSKNVVYTSLWLENQLNGAEDVWHYLQEKLKEYNNKTERGTIKAKIGYLRMKKGCDIVFGNYKPCLVVTQRGKLTDTASVIQIEIKEGQVVKIDVGNVPKNDNWNRLIENPFDVGLGINSRV